MIELVNLAGAATGNTVGCSCCDDGDSPGCDNGYDPNGDNAR